MRQPPPLTRSPSVDRDRCGLCINARPGAGREKSEVLPSAKLADRQISKPAARPMHRSASPSPTWLVRHYLFPPWRPLAVTARTLPEPDDSWVAPCRPASRQKPARYCPWVYHRGTAAADDHVPLSDYCGDGHWQNESAADVLAQLRHSVRDVETRWFLFCLLFDPRDYAEGPCEKWELPAPARRNGPVVVKAPSP